MLRLYVRFGNWLSQPEEGVLRRFARRIGWGDRRAVEDGQTTAEYALVLLAAAAVAFVLIAWAESTDSLPSFFDQVIDDITDSF